MRSAERLAWRSTDQQVARGRHPLAVLVILYELLHAVAQVKDLGALVLQQSWVSNLDLLVLRTDQLAADLFRFNAAVPDRFTGPRKNHEKTMKKPRFYLTISSI